MSELQSNTHRRISLQEYLERDVKKVYPTEVVENVVENTVVEDENLQSSSLISKNKNLRAPLTRYYYNKRCDEKIYRVQYPYNTTNYKYAGLITTKAENILKTPAAAANEQQEEQQQQGVEDTSTATMPEGYDDHHPTLDEELSDVTDPNEPFILALFSNNIIEYRPEEHLNRVCYNYYISESVIGSMVCLFFDIRTNEWRVSTHNHTDARNVMNHGIQLGTVLLERISNLSDMNIDYSYTFFISSSLLTLSEAPINLVGAVDLRDGAIVNFVGTGVTVPSDFVFPTRRERRIEIKTTVVPLPLSKMPWGDIEEGGELSPRYTTTVTEEVEVEDNVRFETVYWEPLRTWDTIEARLSQLNFTQPGLLLRDNSNGRQFYIRNKSYMSIERILQAKSPVHKQEITDQVKNINLIYLAIILHKYLNIPREECEKYLPRLQSYFQSVHDTLQDIATVSLRYYNDRMQYLNDQNNKQPAPVAAAATTEGKSRRKQSQRFKQQQQKYFLVHPELNALLDIEHREYMKRFQALLQNYNGQRHDIPIEEKRTTYITVPRLLTRLYSYSPRRILKLYLDMIFHRDALIKTYKNTRENREMLKLRGPEFVNYFESPNGTAHRFSFQRFKRRVGGKKKDSAEGTQASHEQSNNDNSQTDEHTGDDVQHDGETNVQRGEENIVPQDEENNIQHDEETNVQHGQESM